MHLAQDVGVIRMAHVSGIAEKLNRDANLFPPFFVYYFRKQMHERELDKAKIKESFGELLFENYKQHEQKWNSHERKSNEPQT
jgi:hypothetical protein